MQTHSGVASRPSTSRRWDARWNSAVALCGLFLLAFAIGAFVPLPWKGPGPHLSEKPSASTDVTVRESWPNEDRGLAPRKEPVNSQDLLVGNLTLVDNSGRTFDVPVYEWNERVAEKLMYHSQPLSPEFLEQLRRHQIRSHQSYLPVKLRDGRQVVVPVQELEILPVGGAAY